MYIMYINIYIFIIFVYYMPIIPVGVSLSVKIFKYLGLAV